MIERVQRKFARWLYKRRYGYYPFLYPSLFVYGMVGLETLRYRRRLLLVVHYLNILHQKVDSPVLLDKLGLLVPSRIPRDALGAVAPRRRPRLLQRPSTRTQHAAQAPTIRALRLIGDILTQYDDLDLFADRLDFICRKSYELLCI